MSTRRKTLVGLAALFALIGGRSIYGGDSGSGGASVGAEDTDETDADGDPKADADGDTGEEPELEPDSPSDSGSTSERDSDAAAARFETSVDSPAGDQRVGSMVEFDVRIENSGDASGEYDLELEVDRVDPDSDVGYEQWTWSGELGPGDREIHTVEYWYGITGTYQLRVNGEVVDEFEVLTRSRSRSSDASGDAESAGDDSRITAGGRATLNATEESASEYDAG